MVQDKENGVKEEVFSNGLSDAQVERLAILAEECCEIGQMIGKILRHGYYNHNPLIPNSKTNKERLEIELGDLVVALSLLVAAGELDTNSIVEAGMIKGQSISKWLHHQPEEILAQIRDDIMDSVGRA